MNISTFYILVIIWIITGLITFPVLLKITAPYGRHTKEGWGPVLNSRIGWIIMESPALLLFALLFLIGTAEKNAVIISFFSMWMLHYLNRTLIFPFRLKENKKMPVTIVAMGFFFNLINASINGYYLGTLATSYNLSWFSDPRFIIGVLLFLTGFIINQKSDLYLISLRKPGETGYKIPSGGLFRYISCPNLFGEMIEWAGFALAVWSLPSLAFALWTFFNLLPRAISHHKWYKSKFPEYPAERKAVIPFIL